MTTRTDRGRVYLFRGSTSPASLSLGESEIGPEGSGDVAAGGRADVGCGGASQLQRRRETGSGGAAKILDLLLIGFWCPGCEEGVEKARRRGRSENGIGMSPGVGTSPPASAHLLGLDRAGSPALRW